MKANTMHIFKKSIFPVSTGKYLQLYCKHYFLIYPKTFHDCFQETVNSIPVLSPELRTHAKKTKPPCQDKI